jgi:DNA polymerase elongation subunit (family B)
VKTHKVDLPIQASSDYEIKTRKPKILFFDIETAPNLGWCWGKFEQNIIEYEQEWYMLSWSAKWQNGKHVTKCLADYDGYEPRTESDKALVTELWELFNQADVIVGHNGDKFDIKRSQTRFIEHGLLPPEPYKTVDTLKVARRHFAFNSNKLDDLGRRLGVGRKLKHSGFDLWKGAMFGDEQSWNVMKKYNRQDVLLLERVYDKLLPWITNHPNVTVLQNDDFGCRNCGSRDLQKRGYSITATGQRQRYQCQDCGTWMQGKHLPMLEVR